MDQNILFWLIVFYLRVKTIAVSYKEFGMYKKDELKNKKNATL
jgi:hypothetical protein